MDDDDDNRYWAEERCWCHIEALFTILAVIAAVTAAAAASKQRSQVKKISTIRLALPTAAAATTEFIEDIYWVNTGTSDPTGRRTREPNTWLQPSD